ncbi:MAG TPA: AsmA family protein, partial [Candidatus Binataceae bacterium]|nr:AsmA family protein [Candidatus Binataceae bacterium]
MRKALIIAGAAAGLIILGVIALFIYAAVNLNSIIASNRAYILARASDATGRPVQARDIRASVGWGVRMDITGVEVADNPAFSQLPFLRANNVYVNVEFMPLLSRSLRVTSLVVDRPQVRIIRNAAGALNVSTMGQKSGEPTPKTPSHGGEGGGNAAGLAALTVHSLKIQDGTIYYQDERAGGPPITVNAFDLDVENFSASSPFDVALALAAFSQGQNFKVAGKMGPLMRNGAVDIGATPLALKAVAGPFTLAKLRTAPQLAKSIPPALSISDPFTVNATIGGTVDGATVDAGGDLTPNHVVYQDILDKTAGIPFKFSGMAARDKGKIELRRANVILAGMNAKITDATFADGNLAAKVDTNNFSLAEIGKILIPAQKYNPAGNAEIHSAVRLTNHQPSANGAITLTNVNATIPGAQTPPLSNLSGTIRMNGNSATAGPMTFNVGSGHAKLQAVAQSLQPLKATYQFSADTVKIGDLAPSRRQLGEQINQLAAKGDVNRAGDELTATADAASASGMVANVPFQNLTLAALYRGNRVTLNSLKLNAFDGAIGASGVANLAGDRGFNMKLDAGGIDVQKALESQRSKAARIIRGRLTGNVQVAGAGASFDQIKPTLRGNGGATLSDGKLVGVNVVAQALGKVDNLPGIGALVPTSVVN